MIIGHGDIAGGLKFTEKDVTFFASGVSNSQETRESEYLREKELLLEQDKTKRLVYFSSLSIFYSDTRYTKHKLEMEKLVKDTFPQYCIVRLGNIDWGVNVHTLINNFRDKVSREDPVVIKDAYRYIVDLEEFRHWMDMIPDFNCEMNIPGRRMTIKEIFKEYVLPRI